MDTEEYVSLIHRLADLQVGRDLMPDSSGPIWIHDGSPAVELHSVTGVQDKGACGVYILLLSDSTGTWSEVKLRKPADDEIPKLLPPETHGTKGVISYNIRDEYVSDLVQVDDRYKLKIGKMQQDSKRQQTHASHFKDHVMLDVVPTAYEGLVEAAVIKWLVYNKQMYKGTYMTEKIDKKTKEIKKIRTNHKELVLIPMDSNAQQRYHELVRLIQCIAHRAQQYHNASIVEITRIHEEQETARHKEEQETIRKAVDAIKRIPGLPAKAKAKYIVSLVTRRKAA